MTEVKKEVKKPSKTNAYEKLYKELSKPIEKEYLIEYEEDGKKFTGFNAIAAINRLNEVVGIDNWHTKSTIRKEELVAGSWAISMEITITICFRGNDWVVRQTGSGGAYARKIENAYKGARTSAFKNACKYLGIGKELYTQDNDDDIVYVKEEVVSNVPDNVVELETKIVECTNLNELKALEEEVKKAPLSCQTTIYKKYNVAKIKLMSK